MPDRPKFLRRRSSAAPNRPHPFEPINDPGIAAAASGLAGARTTGGLASVVVTDNYIRKSGCAFCGRPLEDLIHALDDDAASADGGWRLGD